MSEGPKYNMYFCRLSLLLYLCLIVTISHGKYLRVHDEGEHDEGGFQWETESEGSLLGDNEMDKTNDNVVADVGGERGELIENIFSDDSWAWRFTRNSPPAVNDTNFEALKYGFPSDKNFSEICPKRVSLEPHITVEDVVQSFVEGCTKAKGNESQCEIQRVKQYKIDTDELFKTFTDHPKSVRELYDLQGISQADLFQCLVYKSCTTRKGQSDLCPRPCSSSPCSKVENALEGCIVKGFGLLVSDWDCFCKPGYAWDPEEKNCEALEAEVSPSSPVSLQATRPSYTSPKSHSFTTDSNSSDLHIFHSRVKRAPWYSFKNSDWKVVKGGCNRKTFYRSKYDNKAKCAHKCWHHKSCISFVLIIPRNKYQRKQYTCFLKNALCKKVGNSLGRLMYVYIKSSFVPSPDRMKRWARSYTTRRPRVITTYPPRYNRRHTQGWRRPHYTRRRTQGWRRPHYTRRHTQGWRRPTTYPPSFQRRSTNNRGFRRYRITTRAYSRQFKTTPRPFSGHRRPTGWPTGKPRQHLEEKPVIEPAEEPSMPNVKLDKTKLREKKVQENEKSGLETDVASGGKKVKKGKVKAPVAPPAESTGNGSLGIGLGVTAGIVALLIIIAMVKKKSNSPDGSAPPVNQPLLDDNYYNQY